MSHSNKNDWQDDLQNAVRTLDEADRILFLTESEKAAIKKNPVFPFMITHYLARLIKKEPALRKAYIPNLLFNTYSSGQTDPLDEEQFMKSGCLIHRYSDRALLLATNSCASYCRYCTRYRRVGRSTPQDIDESLSYLSKHTEINDVLISGGDPLILSDDYLDNLLFRLRAIKHISVLRIGTNIVNVLPKRINSSLIKVLKKYRPLWLSIHFTHPAEITASCSAALDRLSRAGIPMLSQTVLLKGVNDEKDVIKDLMLKLIANNVKPYYLHHCDDIRGAEYFRVPMTKGLEIIRYLKENISGFAVPEYCLDMPGAVSKVRIEHEIPIS